MVLFQYEKEELLEKARAYDVHKIGENFAFKVDVKNIRVGSPAYMIVKMNDEDVPDTELKPFEFPIRVKYN